MTSLSFARAIQQAIAYRSAGMSQIEAAIQACRTVGISDDWSLPIQSILTYSQSLTEDWCERIINQALDRGVEHEGEFR